MMNICVFCSANDLDDAYTQPAKTLARLLAAAGHNLVWGGSDCGLMKVIADGVQQGGGKLVGISTEFYKHDLRQNADEMIITETLGERKALLLERSDVIVVLAGGIGTLDELTEVLELKKQGHHTKKVIVLSTNGFYEGFRLQFTRMAEEGFLPIREQAGIGVRSLDEFVQFVETPEDVMRLIGKPPTPQPAVMELVV